VISEHEPLRWFTPAASFTFTTAGGTWTQAAGQGWHIVANSAVGISAYYPLESDLAGMIRQEKTLNPIGFMPARWGLPAVDFDTNPVNLIMTIQWLTSVQEINWPLNQGETSYAIDSNETYDELVGMQIQQFTNDASTPFAVRQIDMQTLGTLQPTAHDRLWHGLQFECIFDASISSSDEVTVAVPPSVVTIPQEIMKEEDLQYIYRLKRYNDTHTVEG
tara:strand:- start:666 stop:1322 length:657 start_codon:yes stop_codon:yes gene_type:complete